MNNNYPKYVFLHLAMMVALYASAISFIVLLFQYINILFPDQLYYQSLVGAIQQASATLVVVFPVFLLISWLLSKEFKKHPESREFRLRKWLIYLTLFVAGVAMVVGLITLVFNFFNGELTARFALKVLSVFLVAGGAFSYYLKDIKSGSSATLNNILAGLTAVIVLGVVSSGFFLIGSPFYQRQVRFDAQRVNDLQIIQNEITNYWSKKQELPLTLATLNNQINGFVSPTDPETKKDYQYNIADPLSFELCAVFSAPTDKLAAEGNYYGNYYPTVRPVKLAIEEDLAYPPSPYQQNWDHEAGFTCFSRAIDPELY